MLAERKVESTKLTSSKMSNRHVAEKLFRAYTISKYALNHEHLTWEEKADKVFSTARENNIFYFVPWDGPNGSDEENIKSYMKELRCHLLSAIKNDLSQSLNPILNPDLECHVHYTGVSFGTPDMPQDKVKMRFMVDMKENIGDLYGPTIGTHSIGPIEFVSDTRVASFNAWMKLASCVIENWDFVTDVMKELTAYNRKLS